MNDIIVVFRSRSDALSFNSRLRSYGVSGKVVNTPRSAEASQRRCVPATQRYTRSAATDTQKSGEGNLALSVVKKCVFIRSDRVEKSALPRYGAKFQCIKRISCIIIVNFFTMRA